MIKNKVEQLNNPYGQVTYETFRARRQAFVDKTGIIESLDDEGMTPYPVLLRPSQYPKQQHHAEQFFLCGGERN